VARPAKTAAHEIAADETVPGSDIPGDPEQPLGDPESAARIICLRLLERRARSRAELADALRRRGIPDDAASAVLDRFTEVGLIDDAAFARAWVGSRQSGRGLARRALRAELRARGVDAEVAAEAVTLVDDEDERAAARTLVRRRLAGMQRLDHATATRRLMGMLARKGYAGGLAAAVVREALEERGLADDGLADDGLADDGLADDGLADDGAV
jgi:regulatory protein